MAYLKLMFDEREIAHLSEDGQYLCANEGVLQYDLPLNLFIGNSRKVPLIDVVVWAKKRIFPRNRMDCKEILEMMGLPNYNAWEIVKWCCTIKVDIENSKGQYIEKDKQEATKDGSESTKIQHGI